MQNLKSLIHRLPVPLLIGVVVAVLLLTFVVGRFAVGGILAAVTNTPQPYAISPNVVYNHIDATQTYTITGQNFRDGDWPTNSCLIDSEYAPDDSMYVGVYEPIPTGNGDIVIPRILVLGLATYKQMDGVNEQYELVLPANQSLPLKTYEKFYVSRCNFPVLQGSHWRPSNPVLPFTDASDNLEIKYAVDITAPQADADLVIGAPTPITARVNAVNWGTQTTAYIEYRLTVIPKPGEGVPQIVRRIGTTSTFALQPSTQTFTWPRAGYFNPQIDENGEEDNYDLAQGPWEGDAKIAATLKNAANDNILATFESGIFELYPQTLTVTEPVADSTTEYFWGEQDKTVKFTYRGDATKVKIRLFVLGQPVGGPHIPDVILTDNCPIATTGETTCTFDIPAKPADNPSGTYTLEVIPLDSQADPLQNVTAQWRRVVLKDPLDLTFEKTQGIQGFVFTPLTQTPGADKQMNVKVYIKNTNNIPVTGEFKITSQFQFEGSPMSDLATTTVTEDINGLVLIDLGNVAYTGTSLTGFMVKLDAEDVIDEIDESDASNLYQNANPAINVADYLAELKVDFAGDSDPGEVDSTDVTNKETVVISAQTGSLTHIRTGVIKVNYSADKMKIEVADIHPDTDNQVTFTQTPTIANGVITMNFLVQSQDGLVGNKNIVKLDFHPLYLNQNETGAVWINFEPNYLEDDVNLFSKIPGIHEIDITKSVTGGTRAILIRPVFVSEKLPLTATYLSKKFNIVGGTQKLDNLNSVTTLYNDTQTQDDKNHTKVYLAFFDAQGQNVGMGKLGFEQGFYPVALTTSGAPVDLTALKNSLGAAWIQSITSLQFKIVMATEDHNDPSIQQPWVEKVTVQFSADQAGQIGTISGPTTISVTPEGEVTQTYTIQRYTQENFVGRVQLTVTTEDNTNPPQVQFVSPDPSGLIDIINGNPITVRVKFTDTGAPEGEVTALSFEGMAVDDANKALLPLGLNFSVGDGQEEEEEDECGGLPCPTDGVTVEITAPFEGARGTVHPSFTFRLYQGTTRSFEKTGIKLDTTNKASIVVGDLAPGTYKGFLRSTRHLWKEAKTTLVIIAGDTQYSLDFNTLLTGDVDPNNVINVLDFSVYASDWGKTLQNLLPDFDENGAVNSLDAVSIFNNYFKVGSPVD